MGRPKRSEKNHLVIDKTTGNTIDTYDFNGLSPDSPVLQEVKTHRLECPGCFAVAHLRVVKGRVYAYARHYSSDCSFASDQRKKKVRVGNTIFDIAAMLEHDDSKYVLKALREVNGPTDHILDGIIEKEEMEVEADYAPRFSKSIRELRRALSNLNLSESITESLTVDNLLVSRRNVSQKIYSDLSGTKYVECSRATPAEYSLFLKYLEERWLLTRILDPMTRQPVYFVLKMHNPNAFYDFRAEFFEKNKKKKKKNLAFLAALKNIEDVEGVNAYTAILNSMTYYFF